MAERVAAVDIGTNSVRLLVGRGGADGAFTTLDRRMQVTRLGQGTDATGRLSDAAVDRTLAVLATYRGVWEEADARRVRITATSAARDAANGQAFVDKVAEVVGVAPEILSGREEAALAFAGAITGSAGTGPHLVLDIGGGSTELIRGDATVLASTSRQLGSVRITEQLLHDDPPSPQQVDTAIARVDAEVDAALQEVRAEPGDRLTGTAGTVTTVAALHLDLPTYQPGVIHGTELSVRDVAAVTSRLLQLTVAEKADLGAMAPGRADVIAGGALILWRVMVRLADRTGDARLRVSEADILDGIARSLV